MSISKCQLDNYFVDCLGYSDEDVNEMSHESMMQSLADSEALDEFIMFIK